MAEDDLDVGMKCIKYMLFISNFMFVMIGFLLVSIGSTINAIYSDFDVFLSNHYFSPSSLIIAIGIIMFFVALFGCVGAIKESTCLVNMFALALSLVLILEISAAIAAFSMNSDISSAIEEKMDLALKLYNKTECARNSMDFLQCRLQCCGVHSPNDWDYYKNNTLTGSTAVLPTNGILVPESCVYRKHKHDHDDNSKENSHSRENNNETVSTTMSPNDNQFFANGCLNRLTYIVKECAIMLGTGALCVAFVQLLGVIFANMLAKAIRRVKTEEARKRWDVRQSLYENLHQQTNKSGTKQVIINSSGSTDA